MNLYRNAALASGLACAACQNPAAYESNIAGLQASVPVIEAALALYPATNTPAFQKAESTLNAALAALASAPTPSNAAAVLADIQAIDAALPANTLSPQHQAEIAAGLAIARLIVSSVPTTS
jgi:hypothetical protein